MALAIHVKKINPKYKTNNGSKNGLSPEFADATFLKILKTI